MTLLTPPRILYFILVSNIVNINKYKEISINKKIIKISILDSCLLLPVKLDYLCKVFNTNVKKSILPYDFITKDTIYYKGDVPDFKYFKNTIFIIYALNFI